MRGVLPHRVFNSPGKENPDGDEKGKFPVSEISPVSVLLVPSLFGRISSYFFDIFIAKGIGVGNCAFLEADIFQVIFVVFFT